MATPDDPKELIKFVEELKRQWMSTIDALVDPLAIIKEDYTIHKANLSMALHANADVRTIVGKKCYEVFANASEPCAGCKMRSTLEHDKPETFELDGINDDRFYEVVAQPLKDASGEIYGAVHIYRDRTMAKKMREQLSQQEKLASIGLLAGGIAHEINNPLGGILIFSQMLLREMDKESTHYQDVVEIEAATQRCKEIVENLLNFARQRPTGNTELVAVDLNEAVKSAIRFGKISAKNNPDIEIIETYDDTEQFCVADRNKLIQVFLNLLQNAVQAMPDGGNLRIVSKVKDVDGKKTSMISIVDSGVGIAPEHVKKVFDPFFTTKDPGEGTGLGLALSYGFVQDFGGTMEVSSTVNKGTTFTVMLPLVKPGKKEQTA